MPTRPLRDRARTSLLAAAGGGLLLGAGGCVERTVSITSTPPGAIVWVNDREVGRTPVEVEYVHDGTFDVRVALDGYETVMTGRDTEPPVWDLPGLDFFAEILPVPLESRTDWHFDLEPARDEPGPLVERARELRERVVEDEPAARTEGAPETQPASDGD